MTTNTDALEAILLVARNHRGKPGMGSIEALATYLLNEPEPTISIEPPDAGKQIMQLYDWMNERKMIDRPGSIAEIAIAALDRNDKVKEAVKALEDRCRVLENLQPQINRLAEWIQANEPGAIQGEGAVDTAIAIMSRSESSAIMRRNERIVELEKALKPFASIGAAIGSEWADNRRISSLNTTAGNLSVGEFHAAAKALGILQPMPMRTDAATSPGPVNCNIRIQHQPGRNAYPKTCERCGLGPCPFFNNDGSAKMQPPNAPPVASAC